jgi:hypothetical protein
MEPFKVRLLKIDKDEEKQGFNLKETYDVLLMIQDSPRLLRSTRFRPPSSERPETTKNIFPNQAVLGDDDEDEEPIIMDENTRIMDVLLLIASKKTGNYLWVSASQTKYVGMRE